MPANQNQSHDMDGTTEWAECPLWQILLASITIMSLAAYGLVALVQDVTAWHG